MASGFPSSVTVRVPATSANLGPGFDSLGMALSLYNTFTFRRSPDELHHVSGIGEPLATAHPNDNLVLEAAQELFWQMGHEALPPMVVESEVNIPFQRGLGSSASAVIGGLLGANALFGLGASKDTILNIAYAMEGHGDNAAAALFGGVECVTTGRENLGTLRYHRAVPISPNLVENLWLVACVPALRMGTNASRKALPESVSFEDAAFTVNCLALLMVALTTGEPELLRLGLADKLHQPYRWTQLNGLTEAIAVALAAGDYGACLSGSGSTLLSFCPSQETAQRVGDAMRGALTANGTPVEAVHLLQIDTRGATVYTESAPV